jgi:hypothetical protein
MFKRFMAKERDTSQVLCYVKLQKQIKTLQRAEPGEMNGKENSEYSA